MATVALFGGGGGGGVRGFRGPPVNAGVAARRVGRTSSVGSGGSISGPTVKSQSRRTTDPKRSKKLGQSKGNGNTPADTGDLGEIDLEHLGSTFEENRRRRGLLSQGVNAQPKSSILGG